MWVIEADVSYWEIWLDVRKRFCAEFKLTENDFDAIILYCYGKVECAEDTFPILELPVSEVKKTIRRTIPKLPDLAKLTRARKRISDTDIGFIDDEDILIKKDGKWTNIKASSYYYKKD